MLQQVLTESLLLAALGSIAALGVAVAVSRSIPPLISTVVDRIHLDLSMDWRVFGFTSAAGLVTALVFGLAPALRLAAHTRAVAAIATPRAMTAPGSAACWSRRRSP